MNSSNRGQQIKDNFSFNYYVAFKAKTKDGKEYIDTMYINKIPFSLSKPGNIDKIKAIVTKEADMKFGMRSPEVTILSWNEIVS